jgi:hypothetical protein
MITDIQVGLPDKPDICFVLNSNKYFNYKHAHHNSKVQFHFRIFSDPGVLVYVLLCAYVNLKSTFF